MTFRRRALDVTFRLGQGTFGDSGFNTVKLSGRRASASITSGDSVTTAELDLRVYGMTQTVMNALTILNQDYAQRLSKGLNFVTVEASGEDGGVGTVFTGGIVEAWADFSAMPETSFVVKATTGLVDRYASTSPSSFNGPADAAIIMQSIAAKMGVRLENNGVQGVMLTDRNYPGSAFDQMQAVARDADINAIIDPGTGNLVIWPRNGSRGGQIPLINASSGMVGFPSFTEYGVQVTTLYNPAIAPGGKVAIESALQPATGPEWYVYLVGHDLEAQVPGGKWFTHFEASVNRIQAAGAVASGGA